MHINAINNYRFNNIHYKGKKQNEIQKPVHTSSTIKAIPVAVLIAMSPLNAPLQAQNSLVQTTSVNYIEDEIHGYHYDKGKTSDGTYCKMTVNTSEDNEKIIEINLTKRIPSFAVDENNNVVNAYRVREVEMIPESVCKKTETVDNFDGSKDIKTKYYVIGSGTEYTSVPLVNNPNIVLNNEVEPIVTDFSNAKYEISAELYRSLKGMLKK